MIQKRYHIYEIKNGLFVRPENLYGELFNKFGYETLKEAETAIEEMAYNWDFVILTKTSWSNNETSMEM